MTKYQFTEPVKMNRGSHYGNNYWTFQSKKVGRRVQAFSNLEYYNLIALEMDPDVEYYCEQPYKADIFEDGRKHHTVFDVWVYYTDGRSEFQEVKYSKDIDPQYGNERTLKQIARQKKWCRENNMNYRIRTENDIHVGKMLLTNLISLQPKTLRDHEIDRKTEDELMRLLSEQFVTVEDAINSLIFPEGLEMDSLAVLFQRGRITFKQIENAPISFKTEVLIR